MPRSLQISYAQLLERARKANDPRAVKQLESIGAPPFDTKEKAARYFEVLGRYESDQAALSTAGALMFAAPRFSLRDMYSRYKGFAEIPPWRLYEEIFATDLPSLGRDFKIPVYFFQGADDDVTPASLAREYFERIDAPHKEMVLLEGVGHYAVWIAPDRLLRELVTKVRARLP